MPSRLVWLRRPAFTRTPEKFGKCAFTNLEPSIKLINERSLWMAAFEAPTHLRTLLIKLILFVCTANLGTGLMAITR